tara:strand:- start:72 stop:404 length:333 start_codon:yes stop_codon:yes gene_type:complete
MTDKEILEEVYRRLKESDDPHGWKTNPLKDGVTSFIEQEWQRQDDEPDAIGKLEAKSLGQFSETWYDPNSEARVTSEESKWRQANHPRADSSDPHRGLDISEDGTVTRIR